MPGSATPGASGLGEAREAACGQQQPYGVVAESSRSMALSTRSGSRKIRAAGAGVQARHLSLLSRRSVAMSVKPFKAGFVLYEQLLLRTNRRHEGPGGR